MSNLNGICNCLTVTQNTETKSGILQSKVFKVSAFVLGIIVSISCITIGALGLLGSSSFIVLILGVVLLGLMLLGILIFRPVKSVAQPPSSLKEKPKSHPILNVQGNAALQYVTRRLDSEKNTIQPISWRECYSPNNKDISYLYTLRQEKYVEILNLLHINESLDDPKKLRFPNKEAASDETLTSAITEYLQLSFAISVYSLQDLKVFRINYSFPHSNLELLVNRKYPYSQSFYVMSDAYKLIRHLERFCEEAPTQEESQYRIARFYEAGTVESEWRALFNCFCEQARWYLGDEQLVREREERLLSHSRVDLDPNFKYAGDLIS
ncbi:hypothetical protein O1W69_04980 [Chlamydia sp. 12-01]|uniref:hypothetical protein n=1 Tax=Chlamydia sp. 12-01 TaxID=3002742 RepID=UPI0035D49BFE